MLIDSHCHLTHPDLITNIENLLLRAKEAGVDRIITISDEIEDSEKCQKLALKYEQIFYTVGMHPHHAIRFNFEKNLPFLRTFFSDPKCKAVGEIGLDYHYMNPPSPDASGLRWTGSPKDVQKEVFRSQLMLAKELNVPAVVHCREAIDDIREILEEVDYYNLVLHCCSEKWEDIASLVERGVHLSFTGIALFPKSEIIRETIRQCPLEKMMIETDSPFLAPPPYRGKTNEPAFVRIIAESIASLKGLEFSVFTDTVRGTTERFFHLLS